MIRLDATTLSLEAVLAGAVTTNQLQCYVTYSDDTGSSYSGGSKRTLTNGVTAVTICAAPGAGIVRDIDYINIYNNDTVAASLVVRLNDNGTFYTLRDVTLNQDDCLTYTHARGWFVTDLSGSAKELLSGATFGNVSITGVETYTAVGNQQVISQDASKFREAQQSTLTSGTAYTTNGSLLIMKAFLHNTGIDTSGNLTAADATDFCSALIYSEDDKLKGFSSAAAVTAGNIPTLSNTWYLDNITGNQWINGTFTQGDQTAPTGTQLTPYQALLSTNNPSGQALILRASISSVSASGMSFLKSRGTNASPTVITTGDILGAHSFWGYDGANYKTSSQIVAFSEGTIATNVVPGRLSFRTSNSAGVITEALYIDSSQNTNVLVAQQLNSKLLFSATAPTISSGFGTSPSITANGTLTFRLNVGTGGTASSGVIGLPTASTGWNVKCDVFNPTATNLLHTTSMTASTTTSATITNYLTSTGAATAWPASTVLIVTAVAY